jgi:hypothetical protein
MIIERARMRCATVVTSAVNAEHWGANVRTQHRDEENQSQVTRGNICGMAGIQEINVYTSLPPTMKRIVQNEEYGNNYQTVCISSWRDAGLAVTSVNSRAEIEALEGRDLGVKLLHNGSERDRTKISTLLSIIAESGNPVAGIINADCILIEKGFMNAIADSAKNSVILLERLDLDPITLRPTGERCLGFDAMFFDTRFIKDMDKDDTWLIGEPFWDYWFPLSMIYAGAKLKLLGAPILLHVDHEKGWQQSGLSRGMYLWDRIVHWSLNRRFPPDFVQAIQNMSPQGQSPELFVELFVHFIFDWFRCNAEQIEPVSVFDDFFRRFLVGLSQSKEKHLERGIDRSPIAFSARLLVESIIRLSRKARPTRL